MRATIGEVIAHDEALTMLSADSIGDDDIHVACVAAVAAADFAEDRGSVLFKAALAAIRSAEQRRDGRTGKGETGKEE
ncbi:hypothetical protein [Afipia birgiae]|uniref:hypothetical protein n=1 Tax=Afipia birgiae TaxID=151414 RepID=UPI0002F57D96|nr:hypothetical protein [Afipia birgiae]